MATLEEVAQRGEGHGCAAHGAGHVVEAELALPWEVQLWAGGGCTRGGFGLHGPWLHVMWCGGLAY